MSSMGVSRFNLSRKEIREKEKYWRDICPTCSLPPPQFTTVVLAVAERHCVKRIVAEFYPDWSRNVASTDRNLLMAVIKVQ